MLIQLTVDPQSFTFTLTTVYGQPNFVVEDADSRGC